MSLEDLILQLLQNEERLRTMLTTYQGRAAVFCARLPDTADTGWAEENQFPNLVFFVEHAQNREKQNWKSLQVQISAGSNRIIQKNIEIAVKECFDKLFLRTEDTAYAVIWKKTKYGFQMKFDLYEYPYQETMAPDSIRAITAMTESLIPQAVIIGKENSKEIVKVSAEAPAFYFNILSTLAEEQTNTMVWINETVSLHVFAPTMVLRKKWGSYLVHKLALRQEIVMEDHAPMAIIKAEADYSGNYYAEGQVKVTVQYGIPRYQSRKPMIVEGIIR